MDPRRNSVSVPYLVYSARFADAFPTSSSLTMHPSGRQNVPRVPARPEIHSDTVLQSEFEHQGNAQDQANVDPQDNLIEAIEHEGNLLLDLIPPAIEGGQAFNAAHHAPLMRSLWGFEGILQAED